MGGTPFYSEIAAYCQLLDVKMSPWDISLLLRLYRLNLKVLDKRAKNPQAPVVEASDGAAVAGLLRSFGTKKAKK